MEIKVNCYPNKKSIIIYIESHEGCKTSKISQKNKNPTVKRLLPMLVHLKTIEKLGAAPELIIPQFSGFKTYKS
jgi:hypothetical protein